MFGRRISRAILASTALASGCLAAPAWADSPHPNQDANGVDLTDGSYNLNLPVATIGSGQAALSLVAFSGTTDNWTQISLNATKVGSVTTFAISLGRQYDTFSSADGFAASKRGTGATVTISGSTVIYRTLEGVQYVFDNPGAPDGATNFCRLDGTDAASGCTLLASSVSGKSGMTVTFGWDVHSNCSNVFNPDGSLDCVYSWRLESVSNSAGYSINWVFSSNSVGLHANPGPTWFQRTSAALKNGTTTTGTVNYGSPSSGVYTITQPGGESWRITGSGQKITALRRPTASTDTTTVNYPTGSYSPSSVTSNGVTTSYNYSVSGSTATMIVTDALSNQTTVVSDLTKYRPTSITDAAGKVTAMAYDSVGRLTEVTSPEGNKVQYAYDGRGNLTTTTRKAKPGSGLSDIVTSANYDASCTNVATCNSPNWTKDALGNQTDYVYDSTTGLIQSVTSPAATGGAKRPQTRYTYSTVAGVSVATGISTCATGDTSGTTCVGTADETKTTVAYNTNLLPTSVTTAAGDNSISATTAATYDAVGNTLTIDGPLPGTADTTTFRYDADRRNIGMVSPDPDGAGALKRRTLKATYNADGQPTVTELGTVNGTTDTDWAAFSSQQQSTASYDSNAFKIKDIVTAASTTYAVTQYSYDADGRLQCTAQRLNSATWGSLPGSACTPGTAGSAGPDRIVKSTFDALGRPTLVQTAYGVSGVQSDDAAASYSDNGLVSALTDAEGNKTTYEYDGFDRLSKTLYPSTTKGAGTSSASDYELLGYDADSNVTSRRLRDATSIGYVYDNLSRLTTKTLPGSELAVTYGYDLFSRPTGAATSAQSLSFTYDALGRNLTQVGPQGTASSQYDAAGRRTQLTWPGGSFYVTYDYQVTGEMIAIKEGGSTSLATFAYDDLRRRTSLTRGNGVTTIYTPDNISRLSSLAIDLPGGATDDLALGFAYNPASQISSATRSNDGYAWTGAVNVNRAYTSNGLNQYSAAGSTSFAFDSRGNLTTSGSSSYTYSSENLLLTGPGSASLTYDPLLRLYQTSSASIATARFAYDGTNLIAEYDTSNALQKRYVFGPGTDEALVEYDASGNKTWLIADERGSIIARTNALGAKIATGTFDEYGIPGSGNAGRFQYTGQAWLPEVGMSYYKARIYSPTLGRFMQTDPIGYGDGMNWYNYVGGDPINLRDPTGLEVGSKGPPSCSDAPDNPDCIPDAIITAKKKKTVNSDGGDSSSAGLPGVGGADTGGDIIITASRGQSKPPSKKVSPGVTIEKPTGDVEIECCDINLLIVNIKIHGGKVTIAWKEVWADMKRQQRDWNKRYPNASWDAKMGLEPPTP